MPITRVTLDAAIQASGGAVQPDDQISGLLTKLMHLEACGRYRALLKTLSSLNDKSNFLAFLLEVTFAYQFETAGMPLEYEVKQEGGPNDSIDFKLVATDAELVFFELRLQQQDQATAQDIAEQLALRNFYATRKDGFGEREEIWRLQSTILQKVQRSNGAPAKFGQVTPGQLNIVVVSVSDILLGTADAYDCVLTACGDVAVPEHCRRGVFGLFQDVPADADADIRALADKFARARQTLHGVLFVFRQAGSGVLDYTLQQVMVWNSNLISKSRATPIAAQIALAIHPLVTE